MQEFHPCFQLIVICHFRQPVPSSKDDLRNQDTRDIFRKLAEQSNDEYQQQQQQQQSNSYNAVEDKFSEYRNLSLVTSPAPARKLQNTFII